MTIATGLDIKLGSKYLVSTLSVEFKTIISKLYTNLYPNFSEQFINGSIYIPSLVHKYPFIIKNGTHIHSLMRQGAKSPYVLASPVFEFSSSHQSEFCNKRPAKIHYFIKHSVLLPGSNEPKIHVFAVTSWPMVHPQRFILGIPVEVWCNELYG